MSNNLSLDAKMLRELSRILLPMGDAGENELFLCRESFWLSWILFSKYSSALNYSDGAAAKVFSNSLNFTPGAVSRKLDKFQEQIDKRRNENKSGRRGRGRGGYRGGRGGGRGRGGNNNRNDRDNDYQRDRSRGNERDDRTIDDRRKSGRKVTCYL